MPADHVRIMELRDRLRADPAPFVYAQLAEEHRRARDFDEAVTCSRECVARYPAYLSVRVILGRALAERGDLDEAAAEFEHVLASAPDNLTATRDLAEIELLQGRLERALEHYRRALALFQDDAELEERIREITEELAAASAGAGAGAGSGASAGASAGAGAGAGASAGASAREADRGVVPVGAPPADFDAILSSLGATEQRLPPLMEMLLAPVSAAGQAAAMAAPPPPTVEPPAPATVMLSTLEGWLSAIEKRRTRRPDLERDANRSA